MSSPLESVGQAIDSVDRLHKFLSKGKTKQVVASGEKMNVKAVTSVWFDTLRPTLQSPASAGLLEPLNRKYTELLNFSDKSTSRSTYKSQLRTLKAELMRFREQVVILTNSGQIIAQQKPSFSRLVVDMDLLTIVDRRWDETESCLEKAPLAAVVMTGALLEALLLSRINREPNKGPLFKLNCIPKDSKGKTKEMRDWTLSDYINVCFEMNWIRKPLKDIGVVLRDYRNLIHPREELKQKVSFDSGDAKMIWSVFSTMADQIVKSV